MSNLWPWIIELRMPSKVGSRRQGMLICTGYKLTLLVEGLEHARITDGVVHEVNGCRT